MSIFSIFQTEKDKIAAKNVALLVGMCLAAFFGMKTINEMKTFGAIKGSLSDTRTIDVNGTGDAFAIADVAMENITVEQKGKNVHDAQVPVAEKIGAIVDFLKQSGVAEKDIKTFNYSANPEYSYPAPCYTSDCPRDVQPKIVGYSVSQTLSVKIRNTDDVGKITDGIGALGVTSISGPDFSIDDEDAIKAEARKNAIDDAKAKAEILAKDLGVHLVRIVRFSEGGGAYPAPMYAKSSLGYGGGVAEDASTQMPVGQNKYTSNVTITYEIR